MGAGLAEHHFETAIQPEASMYRPAESAERSGRRNRLDAVVRAAGAAVGGMAIGSAIGAFIATSIAVAVASAVGATAGVCLSVFDTIYYRR